MPQISIIVPVYNVEKYLDKCLKSIRNQSFKDYEVIVVDDGSPDHSNLIYEKYAKEDTRFKYIKQENGGVSNARNNGLSAACGEYVIFIDSDDWMPLNALEILFNKATKTKADMTVADVWIVYNNCKNEYVHLFAKEYETTDRDFIKSYKKGILAYNENPLPYKGKCLIPTGLGGPWNKLIRRKMLIDNNIKYDPYVKGIFDDCLFSLEVLEHSNKIAYINKPVYFYRMVNTSILHGYKANVLKINNRIFKRIEDHIHKYETMDEFKKSYSFYVARRFNETLGTYFFSRQNPKKFFKTIIELKSLLSKEPYKSAFLNVDTTGMSKSRRLICKEAKNGNAFLIWVVFMIKQAKLAYSAWHTEKDS